MATVTATDSEIAIFRHQAGMVYHVVQLNIEGLTHEESLIAPTGGANCLNWVLGHLVCIYNEMLPILGQEQVIEGAQLDRYSRGSAPSLSAAEAIALEKLVEAWDEASKSINTGLKTLTADLLNQPAPYSPGKNPDETVRTLLTTVLFHQAYHAGQTGVLRRVIGKEGAIG